MMQALNITIDYIDSDGEKGLIFSNRKKPCKKEAAIQKIVDPFKPTDFN
jgi:hypothetical protein